MTNEDLLQKILNSTIERLGRQATQYEAEVANLTSQVIILSARIEESEAGEGNKNSKVTAAKVS
jgi:hypothetical protein